MSLLPGGPAAYQAPAAREHGRPPQGLVNPFPLPLLNPGPALVPLAETVAEAAASTLLAPVALVLGLLLGSTTPANAPGISQPHLPPVNPDELRLVELVARHATSTLTSKEEAELITLLAKVKGIHLQKLADLKTVSTSFVGKVPMEKSDLGRMALKHRIENNAWHDGNITVFEYKDNQDKLQHLVQSTLPSTGKHAERLALEKLKADGISFGSVKRIYSELEPCETNDGGIRGEGCKAMINNDFPSAKVTYSYDYAGRFTDTRPGRQASITKRAADFAKYKSFKP